jgi:hypothetical protein
VIPLRQPPNCWNYRHVPPHPSLNYIIVIGIIILTTISWSNVVIRINYGIDLIVERLFG